MANLIYIMYLRTKTTNLVRRFLKIRRTNEMKRLIYFKINVLGG